MSGSTGPSAADWQPARVRFMASGRAEQTPVALEVAGRWLQVTLLAEELVTGPGPEPTPTRRYRLEAGDGRVFLLRPHGDGGWRWRLLRPAGRV